MCGIFGCIGKIGEEKMRDCVERLRHRGPDAMEIKMLQGVSLGHTRLSILDVSDAANQPMSDVSGRYWIVFNGEIYNFIELKKELTEKGYRFRTQSDTEVVLYAYIEWGEKFQDKCNGMWALAIWDEMEKRLFLSRDRFGIKPLFIYRKAGNFFFASEMKAFFPVMDERVPNYAIFDGNNYMYYESTDVCVIKGIKRFPAGSFAIYQDHELKIQTWWNTLDHLMELPQDYEKQTEIFREIFRDACKIRMRSDVPIGTALSGGVDSSTVLGVMHDIEQEGGERIHDDWQHAFVASMPGTSIDETKYAHMAAAHCGIEEKRVPVTCPPKKGGIDSLLHMMYLCEDPYITAPIPFMQTYGAVRDNGIKVTVDGHGADELFGGYEFDVLYLLAGMDSSDPEFDEVLALYNDMVPKEDRMSKEAVRSVIRGLSVDSVNHEHWNQMDLFNKRLYFETHENVLPTLIRNYDRYSMGNGVEIRMPFMDYRVVSFAFSIGWQSKLRKGYSKAVVRDMAKPYMTPSILYRKDKMGFNAPLTEWFQGELKEFLLDTIHSRDFIECGLINSLKASVEVNEFLISERKDFGAGQTVWVEIMPYLWKKAVIDAA